MTIEFNATLWGIPAGGFPESAIMAAAGAVLRGTDAGDHSYKAARIALEAAAPFLMGVAWEQGAIDGWKQSGEGWNAEYPDESTGKCSVDLAVNPYKQHGNG